MLNVDEFETVEVETDVLILGGGMSGCGVAYETAQWAKDKGLSVAWVEKSAIDRSGAIAMGLSAINTYIGLREGDNTCEQYVEYVRQDLMGGIREDLSYDVARHVDGSVHLFEKWGLPIWLEDDGTYVHEGRWQIMINGESYKVIVAEAAKNSFKELGDKGEIYERVMISHLLLDESKDNTVAGAVGFSTRENKFYVFKARSVYCGMGGAVHVFRPRSTGEGLGRAWYPPWNSGSTYALCTLAGAEMTQMEVRFIPARYKDGYGPVGAWFLLFKAVVKNAYGENYVETRADELANWAPYGTAKPVPTCLRNHLQMLDNMEGRGPHYMMTNEAIERLAAEGDPSEAQAKLKELESEAWEDFLDMTIAQAMLWAGQNIRPEERPSEILPSEPVFIGSHAGATGAWCSGPADIAPPEYNWGYNRMTTVNGLFTAGDGCGASGHKFSSGSFTEGRIAGKSMVKYAVDNTDAPTVSAETVAKMKETVLKPAKIFADHCNETTDPDINTNYIRPRMFMFRENKIMDEYCGGIGTNYTTNAKAMERGFELLEFLREDSEKLAAEDLHELMRCWENVHRMWVAETHMRHIDHRKETRWPGYYYRSDYTGLDQENWNVFNNSKRDPKTGEWEMKKVEIKHILPE
jgi:adenylylsulfate reductase subunit A